MYLFYTEKLPGGGFSNSFSMLFIDDNPSMDPDVFKSQMFDYNLYNIFIILGFLFLSLLFFREEDQSLISQNEETLRNLKFLFSNKQSLKIIVSVIIPNGLLVVLASIFNIIGLDQGFDSLFVSLVVFTATICGLIASVIYTVACFKVVDHSVNFAVLMGLTAASAVGGIVGLYTKNHWLFGVMFVLLGIFAFPVIPYMMEKHSLDFPENSMNVINLSKTIVSFVTNSLRVCALGTGDCDAGDLQWV